MGSADPFNLSKKFIQILKENNLEKPVAIVSASKPETSKCWFSCLNALEISDLMDKSNLNFPGKYCCHWGLCRQFLLQDITSTIKEFVRRIETARFIREPATTKEEQLKQAIRPVRKCEIQLFMHRDPVWSSDKRQICRHIQRNMNNFYAKPGKATLIICLFWTTS